MAWVFLVLAGCLEACWPVFLKLGDGFTRLWPSVAAIVGSIGSFGLLSLALKTLPHGTSYAVWTGIGIAGTTTFGILRMGDAASPLRIGCIVLILVGVIGLNLTSTQ